MSGGLASREADANAKFQTAKTQNQDLQDQQLQFDREIERNNKRVASAQSDLDRVSAELDAARQRKAVSEAEYRRLKSEVDKAHGDLASVNMQLDAGRVTGNVDVRGEGAPNSGAGEEEERAGEGARDVSALVIPGRPLRIAGDIGVVMTGADTAAGRRGGTAKSSGRSGSTTTAT